MSKVLEVRSLSKSFGSVPVLHDVSFSAHVSEVVSIIGPSGSGKSTLLRCLNLLEQPSGGAIIVDGVDMLAPSTNVNAMRQRIGMVFQSFNLYPHMTAINNVGLALRKVLKRDKVTARSLSLAALEKVGLGEKADAYPSDLSGGQQQRVAIARALVNNPEIILADEPTGNLDSATEHEIMEMLLRLNREGRTIIMVTHEPGVAKLAKRQIFMKDGVVAGEGIFPG